MSNIKKNFFYNAFYNVLILILPLITAPYISRIMGAERIGVYSYSYSVASYFGLFIMLGLNNYGNRTIASIGKDDKKNLSKTFWNIYTMQLFMATIVLIIYVIYIIFIAPYKIMAWIQIIYLISVCLDINWFFFGIEEFKLTVTRNTIIKILNVVLILLFVKTPNDLYMYGIIMAGGTFLSQFLLWIFLKRYIVFIKSKKEDFIKHIKPNLILFIPVIAVSLYTIMDKIMLGMMSNMLEVGYYESANKLTVIPTMAVSSLGTVMLPRVSNMIAKGQSQETVVYLQKSLMVSVFLSTSMAFGLAAISKEFVPLFYGEGFEKCIYLIPLLVSTSIFISWANVIRTQYLIPYKKDKIYIISVLLGAIINMIVNVLLIPKLQSLGAAIGTVIAEFTVCAYQTYMVKNELEIRKYLKEDFPLFLSGIIMYIIVVNIPFYSNTIITLIIKVICGGLVYILCFVLYFSYLKGFIFNRR